MSKKNKSENKSTPAAKPDISLTPKGAGQVSSPTNPKKISLLDFKIQALVLTIIGFIFYRNTFSHGSAFDDRMAITANEYVQRGIAGIPDMLTKDAYQSYLEQKNGGNQLAGGRYRPLSLVTFAIEQQVLGTHDEGGNNSREAEARTEEDMHLRHLVNVVLYILSAVTLLYFLRKIVFPGQPLIAFVASLLFLIHPIHTEVVANVKSRDEILSLLFILLTIIASFKFLDSKKIKLLILALGTFLLALLSKEYAIILMALLPLSFYLFRGKNITESLKSALPYLIPVALYLVMRFASVTSAAEGAEKNVMNNPYLFASGAQKLATELWVMLDYVRLLIFPNPLIADYSYRQVPYTDFGNPIAWLSIAVYISLIVAAYLALKKRHPLCFAVSFFLLPFLLISNVLFNIGAPMGERLVFHSSVGFSIAVAWLMGQGLAKIKDTKLSNGVLAVLMVVLVVACGFKTIDRNEAWKNDNTLFLTDVKTAPSSVLIENNAAAACMNYAKESKDAERKEWFDKAIGYFDKAISLYPGDMQGYINRGLCHYNMGSPAKALQDWDTVRKYEPGKQNLSKYLAIAGKYFLSQGMNFEKKNLADSAILSYQKSVEAVPDGAEGWYRLGATSSAAGHKDEAIHALERALQIAPGDEGVRRVLEEVKNGNPKEGN